jgi:NAD(P)-dependent dehydrogenase (short-subunit alcohol dehydrogenase family)
MILDTNLKGYFLVGQTVSRLMVEQKYGRIVNVSSSSEKLAAINMTHYTVSKAAISMLTRQMAAELAPYGVNVNSVAPGLIETDINRNDLSNPTFREKRLSRIPTGVIGIPSDVSGTVLHLVSDDAKLMNGATVFVDGGSSIWSGRTS